MKNTWFIMFIVFTVSCSSLKVDLAETQKIFPGIESIDPYRRIEIDISTKNTIEIDSIYINAEGMCGELEFEISKGGDILNTKKLNKGKYQLISGNLENNIILKKKDSCFLKKGTAKIYYHDKGIPKIKSISSFANVRKYKR